MNKYMMATTAIHQSGDISGKAPDLCIVSDEDANNYIGNWVWGFGFVNVKFPKATTRELTPEEVEKYHGKVTMMSGGFFGPTINLKGEDFYKKVIVTKKSDGKLHKGTLVAPVKVGKVIAMTDTDGRYFISSTIKSITGNEVQTRNSTYTINYV